MAIKRAFTSVSAAVFVLLLATILRNPYYLLNTFGGREEHPRKTTWSGHGAFNNDRCWKNPGSLACGSPEDRLQFHPGASRLDPAPDRRYFEYFIKYDIENNITTRLEIENWNQDHDLVLHGLDIWQPDDGRSEIFIFAVNHDRDGEGIALFSHVLGTNTLRFVKEFQHPAIKTPNQVAAAGPRSFFISNDHYFYGGYFRHLEERYGPWKWASQVVYCAETEEGFNCHPVSPKNSHPYANGILLIDQGRTLMVNDVVYGTTTAYDVHPETKTLTRNRTISLGASPDNLSEIPGSGDLVVSVIPNLENVFDRLFKNDPLNYDSLIEAAVLRLVKSKNFAPELLYWDDGSLISLLTSSAVDTRHYKLISGGLFERYFIRASPRLALTRLIYDSYTIIVFDSRLLRKSGLNECVIAACHTREMMRPLYR
ncbi:hypothetical protein B0J12DRAFT_733827 [Macrophomina phaseolina]|uniref:Calcium-dependent phosphotriesterase n=1 Tax=Macrophomina phaseolina TaxID=35725 RepID=A0ABQ8FPS5_9PEZI|nr:hypothetical protein B0J12DRAFT_733827 [Macrophomina phaseolina]